MSRYFAALFILLFLSQTAVSHPGIGIVMDSKGNVYYTDLTHVWKIAPDGRKSIAVRNVHTHELSIDANDNVYGEHLWYEGEATDKWGHRVWRLSADGKVADIIPARQGFRENHRDFFFVRDRAGNMYWAERGTLTLIRKRTPQGVTSEIARSNFKNVRWMTVSPNGEVYLVDLYDLVRISPDGSVKTMAKDLVDSRHTLGDSVNQHAIMGIWLDQNENVYAAVASDREVKRVSPTGKVETVFRESPPWTPSGGMVAPNGDLWLLEYHETNAVRVRRIDSTGKSVVFK